jgi:hypothetical protein
MKLNNLLVQFIPILLIVFFFLYTKQTIEFSHTILGKLIAIIIIIFYTNEDIYHGGLICSIIILYYLLSQPKHHCHKECKCNTKESFSSDDINESAKTTFRKNHCIDNKLKYKNMTVKPDYADMIFEEVSFTNNPCNPCDKSCGFSIIEEKIKKEDDLVRPKDSNDGWLGLVTTTQSEEIYKEPLDSSDLFSNVYSDYE